MKKKTSLMFFAAATLACTATSQAATLITAVSADTYIRNDVDGGNTNWNNDTDNEIIVGFNASQRLNGLIRFDITQIVNDVNTLGGGDFSNLVITGASLQLFERRGFATSSNNNNNTLTVDVHGYAYNFNQTVATYNDPDGDGAAGTGDTAAGGTHGALLGSSVISWTSAAADNEDTTISLNSASLAALIGTVPAGGTVNDLNFILRGNTLPDDSEFRSITSDRGGVDTANRQVRLAIEYTVVPEPSVAFLGGLGLLGLLRRRR